MNFKAFTLPLVVALLLPAMLVANAAADRPPGSEARADLRQVGIMGSVEAPIDPGIAVRRLVGEDLERGRARDLDLLVLDLETFREAKTKPRQASAINSLATHRPVSVVGAQPSDLGLSGQDVPSHPGAALATTVLRSGDTTFQLTHTWDSAPGPAAVTVALDWWDAIRERYRGDFVVSTETYTASEWSLRLSSSYGFTRSPYGVLSYWIDMYRSTRETSPGYDFWVVVFDTNTDPGKNVWGNNWRTSATWVTSDVEYYRFDQALSDWRPAEVIIDQHYLTYSIGIGDYYGGPSFISNLYYAGQMVDFRSNSYYCSCGDSFFQAEHRIDYGSQVANSAYRSEPSMLIRTSQSACLKIPFQTRAEFREYFPNYNDNYAEMWIDSWREACP